MKFKTIEQMDIPDEKSGIVEDARIKVTGYKSSKLYPEEMRLVASMTLSMILLWILYPTTLMPVHWR